PVLGGFLVAHGSWRWAFFINIPLALIVIALTFWRVPESKNPDCTSRLDWAGATLATAGPGGVGYALLESSNRGWRDNAVKVALVSGAFALGALVFVEGHSRAPLLPLNLFRSRNFTGANLLTLFLYSGLSALLFFFPLNLIQVQGYSAAAAG